MSPPLDSYPSSPIGQSSSPIDSHHCSTDESRLSDRKTTTAPPYHITYHRRSKPRRLTFYRFISQASMYIFSCIDLLQSHIGFR
ncbi:hypothetical protein Hanom_Chr14g01263651 [Helianthus anomalus]